MQGCGMRHAACGTTAVLQNQRTSSMNTIVGASLRAREKTAATKRLLSPNHYIEIGTRKKSFGPEMLETMGVLAKRSNELGAHLARERGHG